ncbi:MAG: tyrosine-protein phosphatase [Bacteroidales bacterium]|nr:tyrosine-protein phosphatase [Bacteroidales bacterium]
MQELDLKSQLIGIENANNARQLGGYRIGNKSIREDVLIRSGKLSGLSGEDSTLLASKFKVQCIYDFRGGDEFVSDPDVVPSGARYLPLSISFSGGNGKESMNLESQEAIIGMLLENAEHPAIQKMCDNLYDIIFFEESSQEVYRKFFADLVAVDPDDGAVLWHCTQGKDRAGCASAMLLAALGADRSLIMADYNLSREFYAPIVARIPVQTEAQSVVINTLIGANPVIFERALDKIDAIYGSFANYLKECIGVTGQMMDTLRENYMK